MSCEQNDHKNKQTQTKKHKQKHTNRNKQTQTERNKQKENTPTNRPTHAHKQKHKQTNTQTKTKPQTNRNKTHKQRNTHPQTKANMRTWCHCHMEVLHVHILCSRELGCVSASEMQLVWMLLHYFELMKSCLIKNRDANVTARLTEKYS